MTIDHNKLTETLKAGRKAAQKAIKGLEDGGTCNFDGIFFPVGKGQDIGRKSARVQAAIEAAGCHCCHKNYGWRRGYIVSVGLGGQGQTRTKAAETVLRVVQAAGFNASMWYEVD